MARKFTYGLGVFIFGIVLFVIGAYLVHELIFKFIKFAIGLFLIFLSIPMILGSVGWWRFFKRGKVIRIRRND